MQSKMIWIHFCPLIFCFFFHVFILANTWQDTSVRNRHEKYKIIIRIIEFFYVPQTYTLNIILINIGGRAICINRAAEKNIRRASQQPSWCRLCEAVLRVKSPTSHEEEVLHCCQLAWLVVKILTWPHRRSITFFKWSVFPEISDDFFCRWTCLDILWICTCGISGYPVTFLFISYINLLDTPSMKSSQGNFIIHKRQFDLQASVKEKIK